MNKLLKERLKWGVVLAIGSAISLLTPGNKAYDKNDLASNVQTHRETCGSDSPCSVDLTSYFYNQLITKTSYF